jgi:hypothetical protein
MYKSPYPPASELLLQVLQHQEHGVRPLQIKGQCHEILGASLVTQL